MPAATDMGLRAVLEPELDERAAEETVDEYNTILEDVQEMSPFPSPGDLMEKMGGMDHMRRGAGRAAGRWMGQKLPGRLGTLAGETMGSVLSGGMGGGGGGEGPSDAESGESLVDLAIERNDMLEAIGEHLDVDGLQGMRADGSGGGTPGAGAGAGALGKGVSIPALLAGGGAAITGGAIGKGTRNVMQGIFGEEHWAPNSEGISGTSYAWNEEDGMGGSAEPLITGEKIQDAISGIDWPDLPELSVPDWLQNIDLEVPDWLSDLSLEVPDWLEDLDLSVPDWLEGLELDTPDWLEGVELSVPDWLEDIELGVPDWLEDGVDLITPDWMEKGVDLLVPDWLRQLMSDSGSDGPGDGGEGDSGASSFLDYLQADSDAAIGEDSPADWSESRDSGNETNSGTNNTRNPRSGNQAAETERQQATNVDVQVQNQYEVDMSKLRRELDQVQQNAVEEALEQIRREMDSNSGYR